MSWNINEIRNRIKSQVAQKYKPAYDLIQESYNKFGDGGTKPVVLKGQDFADAVLRDERMKRAAVLQYLDINHKFGQYKDNPKYKDQFDEFVQVMRPIFREALIRNGYPLTNLDNLVRQAGFESRYGLDPRGDKGFNFTGIKWNKNSSSYDHSKHTDGEDYIDFDNLYDFANYHVQVVNNKWDGLNANNTVDFVERLHPNNGGQGSYSGNVDGYRSNLTHMKSLDKYLDKADVEYPINSTYKPYAERQISPASILQSQGAIRSNGGNLFLTGGSEGIFGTLNPIQKLRDRLYRANSPSDYSIGRHIEDTMHPENRVILSDPVAEAMWANYMNQQNYYTKDSKQNISSLPVTGMLQKAQYSPTIGTPKYENVYEVNPELLNTENAYYHPVNDDVLYDLVTKNAADNSITKTSLHNNSLGTYGVSLGEDENGKYISYYDDWDINPFSDNSYSKKDDESNLMKAGRAVLGGFDDISVVGKPFSVYGRRYYTDDDIERIRRQKSRALGGNLFFDGGDEEQINAILQTAPWYEEMDTPDNTLWNYNTNNPAVIAMPEVSTTTPARTKKAKLVAKRTRGMTNDELVREQEQKRALDRNMSEGQRAAAKVLAPLVAAPAATALVPALASAGEAYSAWSAANPILSSTLSSGIESAFIADVANRRLIQGEHPVYGQGENGFYKYVLPASQDLMDATIGLGALNRMPTIVGNATQDLTRGLNWVNRNYIRPYRLSRAINNEINKGIEYNKWLDNLNTEVEESLRYYGPRRSKGRAVLLEDVYPGGVYPYSSRTSLADLAYKDIYKIANGQARTSGVDFPSLGKIIHQDATGPQPVNSEGFVPKLIQWGSKDGTIASDPKIWWYKDRPFYNREFADDGFAYVMDETKANNVGSVDPFKGSIVKTENVPFENIDYALRYDPLTGTVERHKFIGVRPKVTTEPEVSTIDFNTARTAQEQPLSLASNQKSLGGNLFAKGGEEESEQEYVDPNAVNITNPQTLTFNDEGAPMWLGEDNVWRTIPNGGIYQELPEVTVTAQGDEVVPAHLYNQYKDWQANTQRVNMGDYNAHNPIDRALRQFNPEGGTTGRDFLNYLEKSGQSAQSTINMGRAGAGIPSVGFLATEAIPTAYAALQTAGNWLAPKIFTESGALTEGAGKFMLSIPGMEAGREVGEMVYPYMSHGNTWNEDWEKINKWLDKFREAFGYTKEELPEAYINNYGSIVAPRVGFRKYDKGGNLYADGSELSSSRTVGIPAFYNRALGGIINTTNPIQNYANNPHIGIPTVRY